MYSNTLYFVKKSIDSNLSNQREAVLKNSLSAVVEVSAYNTKIKHLQANSMGNCETISTAAGNVTLVVDVSRKTST